jgi:hypothetical protein
MDVRGTALEGTTEYVDKADLDAKGCYSPKKG